MTAPASKRLAAALALQSPDRLLARLADLDDRYNGIAFHLRPEPLRTFGMLYALYGTAAHDGIWKLLAQSEGDGFAEALAACERIGAQRATVYLQRVAALYPGGVVPQDVDARYALVQRIEAEAADSGDRDALAALGEEFHDAMPELVNKAREWIEANRTSLESGLAALPDPAPSAPLEAEELVAGVAALESIFQEAQQRSAGLKERLRIAVQAAGLVPWSDRGEDPRYRAFLTVLAGFGQAEWRVVALRARKHARTIDEIPNQGFVLQRLIAGSGLVDQAAFKAAWRRDMAARMPVLESLTRLPAKEEVEGRSVGVRALAQSAATAATSMLCLHDWAVLLHESAAAAALAYRLFDGLATLPAVPLSHAAPAPG